MIRIYLMPMTLQPYGRFPELMVPKYLNQVDVIERRKCTCLRYGEERVCLLGLDALDEQHAALISNPDVFPFPVDLDTQISTADKDRLVDALENLKVPAHWIVDGQTFRIILRRLAGIFHLFCNLHGRSLRLLVGGLGEKVSTLGPGARNGLQNAFEDLKLKNRQVTGTMSLRATLARVGAEFDDRPVLMCGTPL